MTYTCSCQLDKGCCKWKIYSKCCSSSFRHWLCCCRELFPPKELSKGIFRRCLKSAGPLSPQTPIWKGKCQSDHFGLSSFPSNQVVHVIDSDSVAQSMRIHKAQRQGNTHITLSPLLQLMGEPGKCWSKTVLKGLYRSTQVLGALVICLWFPSMSFSKTGWNCTVYFQGRFTR